MNTNPFPDMLVAFADALHVNDPAEIKRSFEALRTELWVRSPTERDVVNRVLALCVGRNDICTWGIGIAQLASPSALAAYRQTLIAYGACGALISLSRTTLTPLTREEMVALGHAINERRAKVAMEDAMRLFVAARDTATMTDMDIMRLERQLGYGVKHYHKR